MICEIREGIGLCDNCGMPRWPQEYWGYGTMLCLDCIVTENPDKVFSLSEEQIDKLLKVEGIDCKSALGKVMEIVRKERKT